MGFIRLYSASFGFIRLWGLGLRVLGLGFRVYGPLLSRGKFYRVYKGYTRGPPFESPY